MANRRILGHGLVGETFQAASTHEEDTVPAVHRIALGAPVPEPETG